MNLDVLANTLTLAWRVWSFLLLVWIILSWIPNIPRSHPLVQAIDRLVQPTVAPFRKLLPRMGPLDVSPLLAIAAYQVIYEILMRAISHMAGG